MSADQQAAELFRDIRSGSVSAVARAITLCESSNPSHRFLANKLVALCQQLNFPSLRIAVTGSPGSGKSSLIEVLGISYIAAGKKVGVLAIDPSSPITGGSILGDKTRMTQLSTNPSAFVRPSPSKGDLGGIARNTREAMCVLEAAGYDLILIETVGVGQGEYVVADIVDIMIYVSQPNSGDDLQAIKRGILELANIIAVNKWDGALKSAAEAAKSQFEDAMIKEQAAEGEVRAVICCSASTKENVDFLMKEINRIAESRKSSGRFAALRKEQKLRIFNTEFSRRITETLALSPKFLSLVEKFKTDLDKNGGSENQAAEKLVHAVLKSEFAPDSLPS